MQPPWSTSSCYRRQRLRDSLLYKRFIGQRCFEKTIWTQFCSPSNPSNSFTHPGWPTGHLKAISTKHESSVPANSVKICYKKINSERLVALTSILKWEVLVQQRKYQITGAWEQKRLGANKREQEQELGTGNKCPKRFPLNPSQMLLLMTWRCSGLPCWHIFPCFNFEKKIIFQITTPSPPLRGALSSPLLSR